jgi:TRAP-type C4-dicarboxylate transport system permease small subunit
MFDPSHIAPQYDWSPVLHDWRTILLLLISLTIVVSSWEGYLGAIERMPLEDAPRFWIDIALVFSYLLLTLSSQVYNLWFSIHMVIFLEYLAWDIARSNLDIYKERQKAHPQWQHQLSMVITIVWLVYFLVIFLLKNYTHRFDGPLGFTTIALAALAGVILYRLDKKYRWCWPCKIVAGVAPLLVLVVVAYLKVD